jgi:hypothetical protein
MCFADPIDDYKSTCKDIGFKPGTEKFGDCVLKLKKKDVQVQTDNASQMQNQYLQQQLELQNQVLKEQIRSNKAAERRTNFNDNINLMKYGFEGLAGPKPQPMPPGGSLLPPPACTYVNGVTYCK